MTACDCRCVGATDLGDIIGTARVQNDLGGTLGLRVLTHEVEVVIAVGHVLSLGGEPVLQDVTVREGCLKVDLGRVAPPVLSLTFERLLDRHQGCLPVVIVIQRRGCELNLAHSDRAI